MKKILAISLLVSILYVTSGCTSVADSYADNSLDRTTRTEICKSLHAFVQAPLDDSGLRRAWFLPNAIYEDGTFDFYAPMAAEPTDDVSMTFYKNKVGQLTHYLEAPKFAAALAQCLTHAQGYTRICQVHTKDMFSALFTSNRNGRSIEIMATEDNTNLLIASKDWDGNREQVLQFKSNKTPINPTCKNNSSK